MDDAVLKTLLNQARGTQKRPASACLDDVETALFAAGKLGAAQYDQAVDHVADCDDCLDRITAIIEFEREPPAQTVSPQLLEPARSLVSAPKRRGWTGQTVPLAVAASLLVLVLGALLLSNPQLLPGHDDATYREVRSTTRSNAVPALRFPKDAQMLHRADLRFTWTQVEDGLYYEVQLLSGNGDMLWQDRSEAADSAPPESLYLEPGQIFYVWVRAYLRDGKTAKSEAVSFVVMKED